MTLDSHFSPDTLGGLEFEFTALRTGTASTPFLVDMAVPSDLRKSAIQTLRHLSIGLILQKCPTVGVWGILTPLAENYAVDSREIYRHIAGFLEQDFSDQAQRESLKYGFRRAARHIGLPIPDLNDPNMFFIPLGPAQGQHAHLAQAFVAMALSYGPPATEDTSSASDWQRRAVVRNCPNHTRLKATIWFDQSAHCARRFDAWRRGDDPQGHGENHLFEAYAKAMSACERTRSDVVAPPHLFWTGKSLSIEVETSQLAQSVHLGVFLTPIKSGGTLQIPAPWPQRLTWRCGGRSRDFDLAPGDDEILVFDADSGALLTRARISDGEIGVAAQVLVVLTRRDFTTGSVGPGLPSDDPDCRVAWIDARDTLTFDNGQSLRFTRPSEAAIWLKAAALAHDASRPLLASDGALVVEIDPDIGGRKRILRASHNRGRAFREITVNECGHAHIPFADLGLNQPGDPVRVRFEVLAPGAAGDEAARAELSVAAWIWPGVTEFKGDPANMPKPATWLAARSTGLRELPAGLEVDDRANVDAPILGLSDGDDIREFTLALRRETLWHNRISTATRTRIPRGKILVFGQASRHDTLTIESPDTYADILVLGQEVRRPFITRSAWEIGASQIEAPTGDDRIAVRRQDGRIDVLARLQHIDDPCHIAFSQDDVGLELNITPTQAIDALRVRIERADGSIVEGDKVLGRIPAPLREPAGVTIRHDMDSGQLSISIPTNPDTPPGRAILLARAVGGSDFDPIKDADGVVVAAGLAGQIRTPDDRATLNRLATFLAERSPVALGDQIRTALLPAYATCVDAVGSSRMIGSIRSSLLAIPVPENATPRHDLVAVAPWIFEGSATALYGLDPETGLDGLDALSRIPAVPNLPDPRGDHPMQDWLARVTAETNLPRELEGSAIKHAFRTLRFRTKDTDMRELVLDGPLARSVRLITEPFIRDIDSIRAFDTAGGGDPMPARIVAAIERLARAAALKDLDSHVAEIVQRTGLPREDVGPALTLMLRAGLEFFVYYRALWAHAVDQHERQT